MTKLYIRQNGDWFDAYSGVIPNTPDVSYGIRMGDGFLDALLSPPPLKSQIEYTPRVGHGKVVLRGDSYYDSKELTLTFRILADNKEDLEVKREAFYALLFGQWIDLRLGEDGEVYHLHYTGKSTAFGMNLARTSFYVTAKFDEINPSNRE